jgi:hypothetical protein
MSRLAEPQARALLVLESRCAPNTSRREGLGALSLMRLDPAFY